MELNKSAKRYHIPLTFKSKGGKLLHYQFAPPQERMQVPGVPQSATRPSRTRSSGKTKVLYTETNVFSYSIRGISVPVVYT